MEENKIDPIDEKKKNAKGMVAVWFFEDETFYFEKCPGKNWDEKFLSDTEDVIDLVSEFLNP